MKNNKISDAKINKLITAEEKRQLEKLNLIASENYTSQAVRQPLSSVLVHKYSEGEPGARYYEGNENIDQIEKIMNNRALGLFGLSAKKWHVNGKAQSATLANLVVISALLEPKQKILAMDLTHGGHLSHGWQSPSGKPISFASKIHKMDYYKVNKNTQKFDYNKILLQAKKFKPQLIISGGTAYARDVNYKKMAEIAHSVGAYYLADVAHEAGLIASKALKSPFKYADVITMSTQKTLRGPRGALIFCRQEYKKQIDKALFPGLMGGPSDNVVASIAVCLKEAQTQKFKKYAKQTVKNAKFLAKELKKFGFNLVSGGTDKHLILIDLRNLNLNGAESAQLLYQAGIVCNKNTVPYETGSPVKPSGIRVGTAALTTRGMQEKEMQKIATWIKQVLIDKKTPTKVLVEVKKLTSNKKYKITS